MSEIELILAKLKIVSEEQESGMYLCDKEHSKLLLDCITNLREEVKSANESIIWWTNRFNAVQKENEKLKEEVEQNKNPLRGIFAQVTDDDLLRSNGAMYSELEDYKSRCEKAIPKLKELNIKLKDILKIGIDIKEISDIENILSGSDKE